MKKLILIPLLFISLMLQATTYHVAKTGNDGNPGTLASPFLTINHVTYHSPAILAAGDTLFVHSGTYNELVFVYGFDGTATDRVVIMNYSNDEVTISGTGLTPVNPYNVAIVRTYYTDYVTIAGFTITGIAGSNSGIYLQGDYNTINNCIVHSVQGSGIQSMNNYGIVENCTVYNVCMSNDDGIFSLGEFWGAGLVIRADYGTARHNIVHDSWGEGLSGLIANYATIEDNIVYDNFSVNMYLMNSKNCIIQRNRVYMTKTMGTVKGNMLSVGICHGDESYVGGHLNENNTIINNIVYGCEKNFYNSSDLSGTLIANNTFINSVNSSCVQMTGGDKTGGEFRNNIIVQVGTLACMIAYYDADVTYSNNLYNKAYDADAVGADDQISVAHISKVGTYSDTSYYRLVSESPAIGGGYDLSGTFTDDYEGTARGVAFDIGALEYAAPDPPLDPILADVETYRPVWATATTATTGGNVIDDGGGTISARGVCWNTTGEPNIDDDDYTEDGSGTGVFSSTMIGLTRGTTYYIRAYATNETGTGYGEEMTFRIKYFFHDGKILTHNGKILFID